MTTRLTITDDAYALSQRDGQGWTALAVLRDGPSALLGRALAPNEASLEAAIEVAEDWLMPHARRLAEDVLEVEDATGRLRAGLAAVLQASTAAWSTDEFEQLFLRLADLATGRHLPVSLQGPQPFVADVVLVRELAHHGRVARIELL